ncbi:MAG TPA: AbrB/MazE/SpoVT family DNA-binding domain-containing protein [Lachnospiraceae bacterium]|mgnify:FL=1|jgi:AbrB family looped-hinge helix DNA binding protein|nr:AbrB/MazE/SpoVT family DNA-binding domain-containing protein [Lachnospiraceae bacterium]HBY70763.1 AbrB/MazE/SpoVT family DNA-binding domain-containing protein [Lachnospiraceae bacterium]HCA70923.1 AbrB/MazE/SpoVT family DNA-binding domain-containing protein [Lachnospiraceae bacterium]HCM13352.1 AbrB/MazE/SpoVT family DNA-binding domain-containing protein [Lachnospiraceae bacterium]HCR39858.1 AbrB/MazE/SpoVT family DNA-binding domain-containing protein [Lachnospiraceae bacterium]
MELAKITTRGQITIPIEIRKKLGVKDGDKVIFIEENGRIIVENAAMIALKNAQTAFAGEAERLGLKTEQDIVDMVKDVRREVWEERHARND